MKFLAGASADIRTGARLRRATLAAVSILLAAAPGALGAGGSSGGANPSGGSAGGSTAPTSSAKAPPGAPAGAKGKWLKGFTVTEYWPVPEAWFTGKLVSAPGLSGKHRIDWLYSAEGVSMQGEGVGLDGRMYHIDSLGSDGWVTADGKATDPALGWSGGPPFWRAGAYWTNSHGQVTFPLQAGGWSNGRGRHYVALPGVTFAPGASLPLHPYASIAVDPSMIPLGSRVYIPAYRNDGHGGWFIAQDTGGAIKQRHIDVFRTPPASPADGGQLLDGEKVFVVRASS